jgi:hypothetical protein
MTKRNFLAFCEQYYGEKYDGIRFDVMDGYLDGKSGMFLDAVANVLVKRFSRANRIAPGPAEIEKYWWENAPDIETARRKLEAMTRGFVNPVLVIFSEESEALEDKRIAWHNGGGNTLQGDEYLLNEPRGQIWSEILHQGKWVKDWTKENERKQEA